MSSGLKHVEEYFAAAKGQSLLSVSGRVKGVRGSVIQGTLPGGAVGEICLLRSAGYTDIPAEVVGFTEEGALLFPWLEPKGLSPDTRIVPTGGHHRINVSEDLRGCVVDGFGQVMDPPEMKVSGGTSLEVDRPPTPALQRRSIEEPFVTGVRVMDALLTIGRGQRTGIFAAPGVGKSSLLAMLAGGARGLVVLALVGERGREVKEFLTRLLPPAVRQNCICVVATSDRPAMEKIRAARVASTIAEYFRDQGEDVLLLMDSVTRYARALRETGLSAGEQPTRRGFPPSVFRDLPRLVERSGNGSRGSITAFYTVLVEGNDLHEPVADEMKSLLDGQIILSADLAAAGHYPAVDVLASMSRLMPVVSDEELQKRAVRFRRLLSLYKDVNLLLKIGEYQEGSCADTDEAIALQPRMNRFLQQAMGKRSSLEQTRAALEALDG